jgi:cell surface protein SprA
VPINKIPILDFMTVSYRYGATYTWNRRPFAVPDSLKLGNTIQNTNTHNINGSFNMISLYNKIPYFRRVNSGQTRAGKTGKTEDTSDSTKTKNKDNFKDIGELQGES